MQIIGAGPITSREQFRDLLTTHKRDGYIKCVVNESQPISHYYECAFPVIVIEGMPETSGSALILYCGTPESFASWQREVMEGLERQVKKRKDEMGRYVQ